MDKARVHKGTVESVHPKDAAHLPAAERVRPGLIFTIQQLAYRTRSLAFSVQGRGEDGQPVDDVDSTRSQ